MQGSVYNVLLLILKGGTFPHEDMFRDAGTALKLVAWLPLGEGTGRGRWWKETYFFFSCTLFLLLEYQVHLEHIQNKVKSRNNQKEECLRQAWEENGMKICWLLSRVKTGSSVQEALSRRCWGATEQTHLSVSWFWACYCLPLGERTRVQAVFCKQEQRQKCGSGRETGKMDKSVREPIRYGGKWSRKGPQDTEEIRLI